MPCACTSIDPPYRRCSCFPLVVCLQVVLHQASLLEEERVWSGRSVGRTAARGARTGALLILSFTVFAWPSCFDRRPSRKRSQRRPEVSVLLHPGWRVGWSCQLAIALTAQRVRWSTSLRHGDIICAPICLMVVLPARVLHSGTRPAVGAEAQVSRSRVERPGKRGLG